MHKWIGSTLVSIALVAPTLSWAAENEVNQLIQKKGCLACHSIDNKLVGPAYKSIAAKYSKNKKESTEKLVNKIINGGPVVWGGIPMPPQVMLKKDEAKKIVEYILSLD